MAAAWLSALNKVPSGPNASGPIEVNVGPCPVTAIPRAEDGDKDADAMKATRRSAFTAAERIRCSLKKRSALHEPEKATLRGYSCQLTAETGLPRLLHAEAGHHGRDVGLNRLRGREVGVAAGHVTCAFPGEAAVIQRAGTLRVDLERGVGVGKGARVVTEHVVGETSIPQRIGVLWRQRDGPIQVLQRFRTVAFLLVGEPPVGQEFDLVRRHAQPLVEVLDGPGDIAFAYVHQS